MKGTWKLKLRLWAVMLLMFFLVYVVIMAAVNLLGYRGSFQIYALIGIFILFIQYLIGPILVEKSMGVREVSEQEAPHIHQMIEELSNEAGIPKPKVGISDMNIPNAFAYGRSKKSGHVCVTQGILGLLDRNELKAVLGHEIGHIKHNDMIITTLVSAIPMVCYYIALSFLFSRNDSNNGVSAIVGILALVAYFISQLLVLFVSRIREYYADEASVEFGNQANYLASALYKLSEGAAVASEKDIKKMSTTKAFFLNDINEGEGDVFYLRQLDLNKDGTISQEELGYLRNNKINLKSSDKVMELFSTHPNMLKRIKRLAELNN